MIDVAHGAADRCAPQNEFQVRAYQAAGLDITLEGYLGVIGGMDGESHLFAGLADEIDDSLATRRVQNARRSKFGVFGKALADTLSVMGSPVSVARASFARLNVR
jgi:hypothetical protein